MEHIKQVNTIKLPSLPEHLDCCQYNLVLIRDQHFWHPVHDLRKCFKDLKVTLLCFPIADHKTKRNNLLGGTDTNEYSNSIRLFPIFDFLNDVECEIETHPLSKLLEVLLH
jgi:hypothetical protein